MKTYYVYILASQRNGTLYIGMTNNLQRRLHEHKNETVEGFTKRYHIKQPVYYEQTESVETAITREKQLKNWRWQWKINLIEATNPKWRDLSGYLLDAETSSA